MPSISTKHLSTTRIWKIPCVDFVLLCQFSKWLQNALVNQEILTCAPFGANRSVPNANHVEKQMHKKNHGLRILISVSLSLPPLVLIDIFSYLVFWTGHTFYRVVLHASAWVETLPFFWGKHHGLPSYRSRITCWMGLWILQLKKGPQALQGNIEWNDIPDIPDMLLVGNCLPYLPNTSKKVMAMGWLNQLHRKCGWHTDEWFHDKSQMEWFNWWLLANIDGLLQAKHLKKLGNIQCICLEKVNHKLN